MLTWVVTFRFTLRRSRKSRSYFVLPRSSRAASQFSDRSSGSVSPKSFPVISFADQHPLTSIESYRYKNSAGRGADSLRCAVRIPNGVAGRSDAQCASRTGLRELTPLECVVADKHRVLQVFSRNRPPSSPLEATLTRMLIGVHSKGFRVPLTPLDATFTKNRGWVRGGCLSSTFGHLDVQTGERADVPEFLLQSHCSQTPLVPQSPKVRDFFAIQGNNSAPPGV